MLKFFESELVYFIDDVFVSFVYPCSDCVTYVVGGDGLGEDDEDEIEDEFDEEEDIEETPEKNSVRNLLS